MIMPPSPALRSSPSRESRGSNHKRGQSFESAVRIREKDDDLALFNEMQTREREGFLLQSAEDLEDSFSTKLRHFSDLKLGISIPVRGENSDLLNNVETEKNDYDWLLTPPDTPLFPSLDDEPPSVAIASRGRPRSQPISMSRSSTMEKSHRSSTSRGSPSPNRLSPSPRSANSVPQLRGRQLSAPHSSPTPRHATPSRRSTTPTRRSPPPSTPSTSVPRSSTPTPRRLSTGSSGTAGISGARGTSPIKSVRGNSASPKIRAWQTNIPGFSSDPPPNLRTSLDDRPASYVRGSSPASRNSRDLAHKYGRQSMSPTASRSISSSHSHDRDRYSSYSRGSIASSGDDDLDSLQSIPISSLDNSLSKGGISFSNNKAPAFSKKPRIISSSAPKRSLDSTIRHLDRKSPNMFRPLLSSVPSTTFYTGKASSAHRSLISRNSSVTTSSNASSDHGTCIALDTEGIDHNQDDMVNECEKIPYHDSHEEIFAFDKIDIVDEDPIHDIKSLDRGPALGCVPVVTGDSSYEAVVPDISSTSDSSHVQGADFSEIVCLEDTVVCSRCGCRYRVTDTEENDTNLCSECSREEKCLSLAISENMTAVAESLSGLSSVKYEDQPFDKVELVVISPDSALANDVGESRISMSVGNVEQDQESYPEQGPSYVEENFPAETPVEESQHSLINHLEIGQSAVSGNQLDTGSGYQQPLQRNDYQSLRFDSPEGAGISILLKRSSSSKGPVVQGRTFTASTISYDDLSFARDSMSSLRSSIGHSSFSASSSADFSSARQIEARIQRQLSLSSRKGDLENKKGEISVKSHFAEIASTGVPANAHPISGFETCKQDENVDFYVANLECSSCQGTTTSSQKPELASENGKSDDTSSISVAVVEEDKFEYDTCRILDTCTSLSREDSSGGRSVSDKDASVTTSDCSKLEGHNMLGDVFEDERSELSTRPMITISETEATRISEVVASGSQDDISTISTVLLEEESVVPSGPDQDLAPSIINTEKSDGILEESTVIVDYQGKTKVVRSLTLEEATDTILFCSSIVQDLAYSAATIAIEKEKEKEKEKENEVTLEASRPMVTILGKSNTNRSDLRHRTGGKRVMKSQKPRQRRVEMSTKPPIAYTENDENTDESTIRNVDLPNQVDTAKPPKLESKCNCSIM
ncbi:uncharacterized protein LOC103487758 isoform X1 [Cucumis melo]|uniref:Uncharacterized protein LOC103487758 isoform X1 n=1 Tax=Cucumis melo TaxID=3656 RepID=A0A1S3BAA3_CUCME|nr:uncharacterized protein LOC103487758 isoform X1 [Cucumis melo]XP_008444429.1 uncharacterized protein LOC103487758 isoform X1 [Cucumis melo]